MCHMSRVRCHMSHVTCHLSHVTYIFFYKVVKLVGGGSVIDGATPSSLYIQPNIRWLITFSWGVNLAGAGRYINGATQSHGLILCYTKLVLLKHPLCHPPPSLICRPGHSHRLLCKYCYYYLSEKITIFLNLSIQPKIRLTMVSLISLIGYQYQWRS